MRLESPEFEDGERIPAEYGKEHRDVSPPLSFLEVPEDAESLCLVVDDPDAEPVVGYTFDHWTVWNILPAVSHLSENTVSAGAVEGSNDAGQKGYMGPRPPDTEHTYRFRLYALDTDLDLNEGSTKEQLIEVIQGHILDKAELHGTYSPSQWK